MWSCFLTYPRRKRDRILLHLAFRKGALNFCVHGTPQRVMPHEQLPLAATAYAHLTNGARDRPLLYHWRELPQVSFLSRQKYPCRDKTYFCRDKSFVTTKIFCRDKHNFKEEKGIFVAANILLSWQKTCFVVRNRCLSRLTSFCRDSFCRDKN